MGFDIRSVTDSECEAIRKAWHDHLVIRIRGQAFDDDDHVRFMRYFGDCGGTPLSVFTGRDHIASHPEISRISNVRENGKPIGALGAGELVWHTDMSYLDEPPSASMLHAIEIPPQGGDTAFLNMYLAYETLPEKTRRRIAGLSIKHEGVHSSNGKIRPGTRAPASGDVREYPGAVHPVVRTHPDTGALSRPAHQCLCHGPSGTGERVTARRALGPCVPAAIRLDAEMAARRPGDVGQPRHDAPARCLRRQRTPPDAPHGRARRAASLRPRRRVIWQEAA
jgi:alpha-ketoglutarate-dependent taurine dioxygenase